MKELRQVGRSVTKVDSLSLASGKAKFTDDLLQGDELYCLLLESPHAHAEILSLDASEAEALPGVVAVFHGGNVPRVLYTSAGQGNPEPSPYDMVLFDNRVRFVGDRVALVAAETEEIAREACAKIRVEYRELPANFRPERARDPQTPRLHGDQAFMPIEELPYRPEENVASEVLLTIGDPDGAFEESDFVEEHSYSVQYASHAALEPHTSHARLDPMGRLVIHTSTQVPFHARRITAKLLEIPVATVRVIKPRIGGGFGGKQEVLLEPLVGLVTWKTRRPARLTLSRKEVFTSARTRHPMKVRLKTGFLKDGTIKALEMENLMTSGAYGPHAMTVLTVSAWKCLPLYNKVENLRFTGHTVYTNTPVGGAYRGYGATQSHFATNQQLDIIARTCGKDVLELAKSLHIKEGETSPVFEALGEGKGGVTQTITSCKLSECIDRGAEALGWYEKRDKKLRQGSWVRGVGMAICMQGTGLPRVDLGAATMKMNEGGSFNLLMGATDLGTGSDTILAQIAAEVLGISVEDIVVTSSDTDTTPFDVGAYASSTTYVSGGAVKRCAETVKEQICEVAAEMMEVPREELIFAPGGEIRHPGSDKKVSFAEVAQYTLYGGTLQQIGATGSFSGEVSPPPFTAQFADISVDCDTGKIKVHHLVTAIDCGQPINPTLAEGQVEGAVLNAMGYALYEEYRFNKKGGVTNASFWDYKVPGPMDAPKITTILVDSYEETGPYGAKSVSEVPMNGPAPAIANALYDAAGVRLYHLPFTPEKVLEALKKEQRGRAS
ncbi:MAG TPA: molybdopterin-dependent oxidoreductase [Synergistaceae bacterium]|nr:molybdopterin-dependent oxidoreductase [Synergistaceae bacterium]HPQ36616.1 molybdopterin-dependent oxidoreductase [Synergistaceae bacterium]